MAFSCVLLRGCVFSSCKSISHWIRAHPNLLWPNFDITNYIMKALFPNKVAFWVSGWWLQDPQEVLLVLDSSASIGKPGRRQGVCGARMRQVLCAVWLFEVQAVCGNHAQRPQKQGRWMWPLGVWYSTHLAPLRFNCALCVSNTHNWNVEPPFLWE